MIEKNIGVSAVIQLLKQINIDGETMHLILNKVGLEGQLLKQLMLGASELELKNNLELREEFINNMGSQMNPTREIAAKVWDDIFNNETLTFNTFEEYWNYTFVR